MTMSYTVYERWNAGNVNGAIYKCTGVDGTTEAINIPGGYITSWAALEGTTSIGGTVDAIGTLGESSVDVTSQSAPRGGSYNAMVTVLFKGSQ